MPSYNAWQTVVRNDKVATIGRNDTRLDDTGINFHYNSPSCYKDEYILGPDIYLRDLSWSLKLFVTKATLKNVM